MLASLADGSVGEKALHWVFAFRPVEAGTSLQSLQSGLAEAAQWVSVTLAPLDEAGLAELVDDLGLPDVEGRRLAPVLLKRTGGNPLYVLETLKQAWVESGIERLVAGIALPTAMSIGQLIDARIARLSRGALALARVASVAGVDFSIALAEHALGVSAMQFADELNELEAAQVLKDAQFAHDLVFDAVLRSVPKPIASHMHARVAQWLERQHGEPARIAQHWIDAGQPALALPWLDQAALRAEAALRNVERLAFLDLRADIEERLGLREPAFRTRMQALLVYRTMQNEEREAAARCDALEALADDDIQRVQVWRERSGSAARRTDDQEEAELFARKALTGAQATGHSDLIRSCQINLFEILTVADRATEALVVGEACLGWIGDHADEMERKNFHGALSVLYDNTGQFDKALAQFQIHRELCERTGDTAELAINMANHAVAMSVSGRIQPALKLQLDAMRVSAPFEQFDYNRGITYTNLCCDGVQLGHYADVFRWADEAERLLTVAVPGGVPLVDAHRALAYLHLGQRARAMQLVQRISASEVAVLSARVRRHLVACRLARQQGQPTQGHLQAAMALLEDQNRAALRESVLIEQALDRPPGEALSALAEIAARAQRGGYGGLQLECSMRMAEIATPVHPELARDHALRALYDAQTFDLVHSYPGELWLHCARALGAAGDDAASLDVLRRGAAWLRATARDHVPSEFRDSFMHRNPVNRELLALAARHRIAAADDARAR
jgi:hypothetical protein